MLWSAPLSIESLGDLQRFVLARRLRRSDKRREIQVIEHAFENGIEEDARHKWHGHLGRDREVGLPTKSWLNRPGRDGRAIVRIAPYKLQQRFWRIGVGKTDMLSDQRRALRLHFHLVPMLANDRG